METDRICKQEKNCWRLAAAKRVAFLIDGDAYFSTLAATLERAQHSILIAGWQLDSRVRLTPHKKKAPFFGDFLHQLAHRNRTLRKRICVRHEHVRPSNCRASFIAKQKSFRDAQAAAKVPVRNRLRSPAEWHFGFPHRRACREISGRLCRSVGQRSSACQLQPQPKQRRHAGRPCQYDCWCESD
jgi:hypothetical protein